jgi:hypothetical protein
MVVMMLRSPVLSEWEPQITITTADIPQGIMLSKPTFRKSFLSMPSS